MLRHILTTAAMILLPYLVYAVIEFFRRRRQAEPGVVSLKERYWDNVPVLFLGLIGCVLAVSVLLGAAILDNNPSKPAYDPPIHRQAPAE